MSSSGQNNIIISIIMIHTRQNEHVSKRAVYKIEIKLNKQNIPINHIRIYKK